MAAQSIIETACYFCGVLFLMLRYIFGDTNQIIFFAILRASRVAKVGE